MSDEDVTVVDTLPGLWPWPASRLVRYVAKGCGAEQAAAHLALNAETGVVVVRNWRAGTVHFIRPQHGYTEPQLASMEHVERLTLYLGWMVDPARIHLTKRVWLVRVSLNGDWVDATKYALSVLAST